MRRPRVPIPPQLRSRVFTVGEARAAGLGSGRLRGRDLARPSRGLRRIRSLEPTMQSIGRALARRGRYLSCTAAAELWGCSLPVDAFGVVHLSSPSRAPRIRGVVGHRRARTDVVVRREGVPVTDPESTWLGLARHLPLEELIACGDHLVHVPPPQQGATERPFTTVERLAERMRGYRGPGMLRARAALGQLSTRAESRPETLLRLLLLSAGIADFEVNPEIYDDEGRWIARCDIAFMERRIAVEYDGDHHRLDRRQYERDQRRLDRLMDAGWRVIRIRSNALFHRPEEVVARVRAALAR